MKTSQRIALGLGSVTTSLPPDCFFEVDNDGTLIVWPEETPDVVTLRISCITLVAENEDAQPVTEILAEEAKANGLKAARLDDKLYVVSEETSLEDGQSIWCRFWQVGFLNYSLVLSVCCLESARRAPSVTALVQQVPKIIRGLEQRELHSALTEYELQQLEEQRDIVRELLQERYDVLRLPVLRADLPVLQQILDDRPFSPEQEREWSSVGVAFGDILADHFGLDWCAYTDEQGAEPALRLGHTSITLYPRSMILRRVERGQEVDLDAFVDAIAENIQELKAEGC
jgi:hypothetical protein